MSAEKALSYNGYKQIAEYTVSGTSKTLSKSTVWQPAASGDLDVVLWYRDGSTVYTLLPDGNKTTRQLKTTAGTVAATYDYDPFGNVIATTGTVLNPWKFSSEYHDSETGLVYYNYRDYAPSLGRWISRDPIGEKGGVNLYDILKNNSILFYDSNGTALGCIVIGIIGIGLCFGLNQSCEKIDKRDEYDDKCKKLKSYFESIGVYDAEDVEKSSPQTKHDWCRYQILCVSDISKDLLDSIGIISPIVQSVPGSSITGQVATTPADVIISTIITQTTAPTEKDVKQINELYEAYITRLKAKIGHVCRQEIEDLKQGRI